MSKITRIVIHCAATANGQQLANEKRNQSAATIIDGWHKARGFKRSSPYVNIYNNSLRHIGYHFVIDTDGAIEKCRAIGETGAHVKGFNVGSIGICLVGTDAFTLEQWLTLGELIEELHQKYPNATICGHRDLSPDLNGDGKITPNEYTKICPGFTVADWLNHDLAPLPGHIFGGI
jgi:N-acetylmuramoyl-L-alanine amidase